MITIMIIIIIPIVIVIVIIQLIMMMNLIEEKSANSARLHSKNDFLEANLFHNVDHKSENISC
jgi:hypothetical protein